MDGRRSNLGYTFFANQEQIAFTVFIKSRRELTARGF